MNYTPEQIKIALGIMSGRIDPERDLKYFDDAIRFHLDLPNGNVTASQHRIKAEEIIFNLIGKRQRNDDENLCDKMSSHRFNQE